MPILFESMDDIIRRQASFEMVIPCVVGFVGLSRSVLESLLYESLKLGLAQVRRTIFPLLT